MANKVDKNGRRIYPRCHWCGRHQAIYYASPTFPGYAFRPTVGSKLPGDKYTCHGCKSIYEEIGTFYREIEILL